MASGVLYFRGFLNGEISYIWLLMKRIELPYVTIENREGIIWMIFREGADLDVKEVKAFNAALREIGGDGPLLVISDARVSLTISAEGRRLAADKKEVPNFVANAVLVNNLAVRLTANFFSNFNKPPFKYRVFNDESKALKWLRKYHLQNEFA